MTVQDEEATEGNGFDFTSVDVTDVAPTLTIAVDAVPTTVPYPGGDSTFSVTVTNTSGEFDTITLDTLTDTEHGDLDGVGTCETGISIAPSASYTCSFTVAAAGNVGTVVTNAVTASISDDDGAGIDTSATDDATVTITERAITVTADSGQSKVYGSADPTLTYTVTSGSLQGGDSFTGALSRAAGENVGTYAIGQGTLTVGPNYTLTFVPADFSITARPITVTVDSGQSKIYGTLDPTLTYSVTSGALQGADTLTGDVARVAGENVGTYAIGQGTLAASSNYTLTFVGANFTITPRPITVTATTDTKEYDATTASAAVPTITAGTLAGTDTPAFTQTFGNANVGTGKTLTPAGSVNDGNGGANYAVTFVNDTTGAITARAITVTATSDTKAYDATTASAAIPTITSGTLAGTDTGSFTQTFDTAAAGSGKTLTPAGSVTDGNGGANYAITFVNDTTGVITGRAITVTAASDTKGYDATTSSDGVPTITSGSLVGGDTATFTPDLRHRQRRHRQDLDAGRHGERRQRRRQLHDHLRQRHDRRDHRQGDHRDRDE